jgi:hypothetical protein
MRWLEPPRDEAERLLREALDQAQRRVGDEITHRRVWARVAEGIEIPERRPVRGRFLLACAALVLLVGGGTVALHQLADSDPAVASAPSASAPGRKVEQAYKSAATLASERAPGHVVRTRSGEHAKVALGGGAEAAMAENSAITWDAQHRPSIMGGKAQLTVPHQPPGWRFSVTAGPYVVTVVGTKFDVEVADDVVGVAVKEGVVEVSHGAQTIRLVAGDAWNGPLHPEEASATVAPPTERPRPVTRLRARAALRASRGLQDADSALRAGNTARAIEILTRTSQGKGLVAENAAYELGRVTRYNLNRPREAVALWEKYRTRFPSGLLRKEADLSILDTLSSLGDSRAALAEADAFLARHPGSERRLEVQKLAERLRTSDAAGAR